MKLLETRILKQTKANGSATYTPQYKDTFLWPTWLEFELCNLPVHCGDAHVKLHALLKDVMKEQGDGLQKAKKVIDTYIAFVNHYNASQIENKVVKSEYIKYP